MERTSFVESLEMEEMEEYVSSIQLLRGFSFCDSNGYLIVDLEGKTAEDDAQNVADDEKIHERVDDNNNDEKENDKEDEAEDDDPDSVPPPIADDLLHNRQIEDW